MALIVENGTGVIGANTYITLEEAKLYAAERGEPLLESDEIVSGYIINAKDYLESFRRQFSGQKTNPTQPLQYPRINSTVDGVPFPEDAIPVELKNAQSQLVIDCAEFGGNLLPSSDGYAVAKEKVDVIEVEYAAGGRLSGTTLAATPQYPKAQQWIEPLLEQFGSLVSTVRV